MKRRLIPFIIFTIVWLAVGCGDRPSPIQTETITTIQHTATSKPTELPHTPTPTDVRPIQLPTPPENPNIIRLTDATEWSNGRPVWSPDSSQILFKSNRECVKRYGDDEWDMKSRCLEWDLYLIDLNSRNEIRLTDFFSEGMVYVGDAVWSRDGKKIAVHFSPYMDAIYREIVSFEVEEAKLAPFVLDNMEVLIDKGKDYLVRSFAWSPDGEKYAYEYFSFWEHPPERWDIVVVDVNNGEEVFRKTTESNFLCFFEEWSPNGEGILLVCERDLGGEYEDNIYWINLVDGTEKLIIENAELPILSPDGAWIIYYSTESLDWIFFHVESGVEFLFPFRGRPWSWSPDGKWLTITKSYNDQYRDIFLLDMSWLEME